jgi:hypothetical protein
MPRFRPDVPDLDGDLAEVRRHRVDGEREISVVRRVEIELHLSCAVRDGRLDHRHPVAEG